jgi:hypothetical protein
VLVRLSRSMHHSRIRLPGPLRYAALPEGDLSVSHFSDVIPTLSAENITPDCTRCRDRLGEG